MYHNIAISVGKKYPNTIQHLQIDERLELAQQWLNKRYALEVIWFSECRLEDIRTQTMLEYAAKHLFVPETPQVHQRQLDIMSPPSQDFSPFPRSLYLGTIPSQVTSQEVNDSTNLDQAEAGNLFFWMYLINLFRGKRGQIWKLKRS